MVCDVVFQGGVLLAQVGTERDRQRERQRQRERERERGGGRENQVL